MRILLRILLCVALGVAGLAVAAYVAVWLLMMWHYEAADLRPRRPRFCGVAVRPLEVLAGGPLPPGVRVTRYFLMAGSGHRTGRRE